MSLIKSKQAPLARVAGAAGVLLAMVWPAVGVADAAFTTTTFTSPGKYSFTVPKGVTSVTIVAIGAPGGTCSVDQTAPGGAGAAITATVPVLSGEALFVGVGSAGGSCAEGGGALGGAGGSGGGGGGGDNPPGQFGFSGAGGGGASLVGLASPAPGLGGPLIVAGAGGGAAEDAHGGDAGSPGENPGGGGAGGGPGTATAGGAGGVGIFSGPGASGSFGIGGTGGRCGKNGAASGGGGGGGYYGGGGGGCGAPPAGGGGGSSFVVSGGTILLGPTPTSSPQAVSITYPAPTAEESTHAMSFTAQAPGTAGPEKVLTVTNTGSAPLLFSGVQLGGSDPGEFDVADRCLQQVAVGSSCEVGVRFHPQAAGTRTAALMLLTNAARAPRPVSLAGGSGVSAGARNHRHHVELITCETIRGSATVERHTLADRVRACTGRRLSGTVKFSPVGDAVHAKLTRGRLVYAVGTRVATSHGRSQLLLTTRRAIKPGVYTLILRHRHGHRWVTRRLRITLR